MIIPLRFVFSYSVFLEFGWGQVLNTVLLDGRLHQASMVELAPANIRIKISCSTFVKTPMTKPYFEHPAFCYAVLAKIPLGRLEQIEEIECLGADDRKCPEAGWRLSATSGLPVQGEARHYCRNTRKRRSAMANSARPIAVSQTSCGQTTSSPAPRNSTACDSVT